MKISERVIQTVLIHRAMEEKHHDLAIPNTREIFTHEADLLSVTKAGLVHEYEIKIDWHDYLADFKKHKHHAMKNGYAYKANYFWYVTWGFAIEPPEYAGWIRIEKGDDKLICRVEKDAPRLHDRKLSEKLKLQIGRALSYRLMHQYQHRWPVTYEHPTEVY